MTIVYTLGRGLYVNMTNRCTCDCDFCERNSMDKIGDSGSLWLDSEPPREDILAAILDRGTSGCDELVFCGFGEPTMRLDDLLWTAGEVKKIFPALPIRVNTNGHASLIAGCDVTPRFEGLVDVLSISLNRPNAESYTAHMRPSFGSAAFEGLLSFAAAAKRHVPTVILTVVDVLTGEELAACRAIAGDLGVELKVRELH